MNSRFRQWPATYFWLLLILPLLLLLSWGSWNEITQYRLIESQVQLKGEHAGTFYANRMEARLDSEFKELELIAALYDNETDLIHPNSHTLYLLKQIELLHPELYAINICAPNGETRLWSSRPKDYLTAADLRDFAPVQKHSNYFFGPDRTVNQEPVVTLRYRKLATDGSPRFYASLIYRIQSLLTDPTEDLPWQFSVIDTRDRSVLGQWQGGKVSFNSPRPIKHNAEVAVSGYPLMVQINWSPDVIPQTYWQSARKRLELYVGMFILLGLAAWGIFILLRQREQDAHHLRHLADFNALLAQVNQTIAVSKDETDFMTAICALAVRYGGFRLAFIAKPDKTGQFQILAANGATGYTEHIDITTDPKRAEGQGPIGQAWRSLHPVYTQEFRRALGLAPWLSRAEQYGIQSSATIPILKSGVRWAVLAAYHTESRVFSPELKHLLEDLAQDITRGLHWIETQRREAILTATQQALLDNTLAGIVMVRERHLVQINARFVVMLGYTHAEDLLGQSTRVMYASEEDYNRVGLGYAKLLSQGKLILPDVQFARKDGSIILCDLSASIIQGDELATSVWTIQDVTQRHALQAELSKTVTYQRALFDSNAAALLTIDEQGVITDANPALCLLTGYSRTELIGQNALMLHNAETSQDYFAANAKEISKGLYRTTRQEDTICHKHGTILNVEILGAPLTLPNGQPGVIWSLIDVTALHQAKQDIAYQALHDTLTGLPNRRALEQHLPRAIARAQRNGSVVAVGMLDLDDFKPVNDNYGHEAGDQLLRALATRLQDRLRKQDLLVRLGGDEFVIVLEDLHESHLVEQLDTTLARLHQSVEQPFEVAPQKYARICMSLGVALYPIDSDQGDGLLRQADATLYIAKTNKTTRTRWWRLSQDPITPPEDEAKFFDAYSLDSRKLVEQCASYLNAYAEHFVEKFYVELKQTPLAQAILNTLDPAALPRLVAIQADHLRFLLNPNTTREQIVANAQRVGTTHALVGVSSPLLMQSMNLYRKLLSEFLNQSPLSARDRYRILITCEGRIQDDILAQLQAGGTTIQNHFDLLTTELPPIGSLWADVKSLEIKRLGDLPGIQAVLLLRADTHGVFSIESSAGRFGSALETALNPPEQRANIDPNSPRGHGLAALAWRTLEIQSTPNVLNDPRYAEWHHLARQLKVRSTMTIPVISSSGHVIAVIGLYGGYPNQFESVWMQQFARNLQLRFGQIWLLCNKPGPVVGQHLAQMYRKELFSGGLCVFMQPIVDLHTGRLIKVEALARLQRPDGEILPPAAFLSLLGDTELDRLFCLVLDQALPWLGRWDQEDTRIGLSVNLSPGTLLDPECTRWIETALTTHNIAPERLTLEILETQGIDRAAQDTAIQNIVALGVPLAMDDLGSGYSSLQRLATLPFNIIKIDQSLLSKLRSNPVQTMSLIAAIIQMGHDFEQTVIVEGLEDAGAIEAVTVLGARFGQGFGLGRPMPAEEVMTWHQQFQPLHQVGHIQTYLGALAHHWWLMHNGHKVHPHALADCPLSQFLAAQGHEDSEAAQWHREIHTDGDNRAANRNLIAWLADQAQKEGEPV